MSEYAVIRSEHEESTGFGQLPMSGLVEHGWKVQFDDGYGYLLLICGVTDAAYAETQ